MKSCANNDIWAWAILEQVPQDQADSHSPEIQRLLEEYEDVFAAPQGLRPPRVYDHSVLVFPNSVPVNSKPYRYSPLHKDEIQRQVRELLAPGLIIPSSSPYASPVLLVQKKGGSWRFHVDYRKLPSLSKRGFLCL